jgi:choline dehydrogenase-like flavoprotein
MSNAYDAIIVGTGQAGAPLAGRLSEARMKVAIVKRKLFIARLHTVLLQHTFLKRNEPKPDHLRNC